MQPTRLAVLFHRFGPYHHARLRAAARAGDTVGIELSRVDATYQWDTVEGSDGFAKVTLFDDRDIGAVPADAIEERLSRVLTEVAPTVIATPGWGDAGSLLALQWGARRGVPMIAMSETMEADTARNRIREAAKARIIGMFSGAIVGGRRHRDYIDGLGMPRERIVLGYDCVDNDYFSARAAQVRAEAAPLRRELNLPERYFLASSRFIERKNLAGLVRSFSRYRSLAGAAAWNLVIIGDGPLRESLQALAREQGVGQWLAMPGFMQYRELPSYYALAGAFIHPAFGEPWGLVVNEAMASSLPVLVSRQSGCAHELVEEGRNGFTFDAADEKELASLMLRVSQDPALPALGAASAAMIARWSCGNFARKLWDLSAAVCGAGAGRQSGILDRALLRLAIPR